MYEPDVCATIHSTHFSVIHSSTGEAKLKDRWTKATDTQSTQKVVVIFSYKGWRQNTSQRMTEQNHRQNNLQVWGAGKNNHPILPTQGFVDNQLSTNKIKNVKCFWIEMMASWKWEVWTCLVSGVGVPTPVNVSYQYISLGISSHHSTWYRLCGQGEGCCW